MDFPVGVHPLSTDALAIVGGTPTTWQSIPTLEVSKCTNGAFDTMELYNHIQSGKQSYRLPTFDELTELGISAKSSDASLQKPCSYINDYNYAFGITYADGATRTLLTSDAYSYTDFDTKGEDSPKGVRGVIIYAKSNGDNLHFPMGSTGHGRRKSRGLNAAGTGHVQSYGYMRYGSVDYRLEGTFNNYRPMAWDLPSQKGAAYWTFTDKVTKDGAKGIAIDFNSGNYMASYLNSGDLYLVDNKPDALPIKPVHK